PPPTATIPRFARSRPRESRRERGRAPASGCPYKSSCVGPIARARCAASRARVVPAGARRAMTLRPRAGQPRWARRWRAGSRPAPDGRRCEACPSSRRLRARAPRVPPSSAVPPGISPRDLHTTLGRLVEQLRGILAQTARQGADVLGRRPALAHEAFDLRQTVARKRAHVLAVVRDELVEPVGGVREAVSDCA